VTRDNVVIGDDGVARCWWAYGDPLYPPYHDGEWGRPVDDDVRLFEKLTLEGFQSGLSWLTILRKRENFREAFRGFDIEAVGRFGARDVRRLLADSGIVRNRAKIEATINNARRCAEAIDEFGSFAAYVWAFEPSSRPRDEAVAMSKDLRRRGWTFVGPTTAYAFMQAMGLVNDHVSGCAMRDEVEAERARFRRPKPRDPAHAPRPAS
jgi:DNA-3-methyladenine glycosylase I